jgi:hypothetical protein
MAPPSAGGARPGEGAGRGGPAAAAPSGTMCRGGDAWGDVQGRPTRTAERPQCCPGLAISLLSQRSVTGAGDAWAEGARGRPRGEQRSCRAPPLGRGRGSPMRARGRARAPLPGPPRLLRDSTPPPGPPRPSRDSTPPLGPPRLPAQDP